MPGPNIYDLQRVFFDENYCLQFLAGSLIFYPTIQCVNCGQDMHMNLNRQTYRCSRRQCNKERSLRSFTFFFGSALPCSKILLLAFLWVNGAPWTCALGISGHSSPTVSQFYRHFRSLVTSALNEEDDIIGGQDIEVEIDETKLGKRKYERGHRVDGVWVLVGVERTPERKVFLVAVPDRTANTLTAVISSHVHPGSIILTDMWRGYSSLERDLGFIHRQVNHSIEFVNSADGTCTNTAEGTNNALKLRIRPRNRTRDGIIEHLGEFIWRRKNTNDLWGALISALREVHYIFNE